MSDRAASPVLGILLLMAFTIAGAMSLFVAGAVMIDSSQSSIESAEAQSSMIDAATHVDRLIAGEQNVGEFSFTSAGDATPQVRDDVGHVKIIHDNETVERELFNDTVGAFVYELDDHEYAYQAGAVWRRDANGQASMVREPELFYNHHTLTYPVVNITGDVTSGQQRGDIYIGESDRIYPAEDDPNPLENGSIRIEIVESRYCTGWEQHFEQQTEGELTEYCGNDGSMVVEFEVPFELTNIENGIRTSDYNEDVGEGTEVVDEDDVSEQGGAYQADSADHLIEDKKDRCQNETWRGMPDTINSGGLYCYQEINDSLAIDTSSTDEEVEIYVRDGMDGVEIPVDGDDPAVSIYFDGDVSFGGGGHPVIGNEDNSTQTRLYLCSDCDFEQTGGGDIYALLYAPESTVTFQSSGDGTVEGAIIGETVNVNSSSIDVEYDDDFEDVRIEETGKGSPFYYLHIVETEIEFRG